MAYTVTVTLRNGLAFTSSALDEAESTPEATLEALKELTSEGWDLSFFRVNNTNGVHLLRGDEIVAFSIKDLEDD